MREAYEFLKWIVNRPMGLLDNSFNNNQVRETIETELKGNLRLVRKLNSARLIEDLGVSDSRAAFFPFEFDFYHPRDYSHFPLRLFCSWKLNKELRHYHNVISAYLHPEFFAE